MTTYFTKDHEWIRVEGDTGTIGITPHAVEALGDIVFFEAQPIGNQVTKGEPVGLVESVKAASDIYAPVSGEILAFNEALTDAPETINAAPEGDGWMVKLRIANAAELESLLDAAGYQATLG
jgi:glycine cleavage system H protein